MLRAVHRIQESASAVLLQSGMDERWCSDSVECCCYLRNVKDILADGSTPYERRFGEPFRYPVIVFGAMVKYHPISATDQGSTNLARKFYQAYSSGYALLAERIWKGDIWVSDIEELGTLDAAEIHARRLNAKEVLTSKKGEYFDITSGRWYSNIVRNHEFRESTPRRDQLARSEDLREELQGNSERSQPTNKR